LLMAHIQHFIWGPPLEDFKETFRLNLTLAGFDPVAIDTVSAKILGINPSSLSLP